MQLAQLNIGRLVGEPDGPEVAEFMSAIPAMNLLGESSPGFVWRLEDDAGPGATGIRFPGHEDDERMIVNLTVWDDFESLRHFTNRSGHGMYVRRRREWFEKPAAPTTVLWWVPDGHRPSLGEAAERLAQLRADGPGPEAFDMASPQPPISGR